MPGCIPGNVLALTEEETAYLKKKLLTPYSVSATVPEEISVAAQVTDLGCELSAKEVAGLAADGKALQALVGKTLESIPATVTYSDGTTVAHPVDWQVEEADFANKEEILVHGRIHKEDFPFPIAINRADPCVMRREGSYYYIATNDADNNHTLYIRKADSLAGLVDAQEVLLLDSETYEDIGNLLWAPEFHEVEGRLYIFHAATPGEFFREESHIMALKEGGDPMNRADWSRPRRIVKQDGSDLCEAGKTISLDMTCFYWEGAYYVVWSQRQFLPKDLGAWLYIAKLNPKEPWKLAGEPVVLSKPDYSWANNHTFVDEGPFALLMKDRIFLTFSSAAVDETYVVSYLEIPAGKDLLNPAAWRKNNYPILTARSVEGEYGTGHNAYVTDENGLVWNTYHARPGADGPRSSGFRRVHFDVDGRPMLDVTADLDIQEELRDVQIRVKCK